MWKILSWVAVGLLAVAAFFSFKNVKQFAAERELLEIAKANSQEARDHLKKSDESLAVTRTGRKKTEDERDAREKSIVDTKAKTDGLVTQITEKKTELEQVTARWAEMKKRIDEVGGVEPLKQKLAELQQEKTDRDEEVTSLGQKIAMAIERVKNLGDQATAMRTREAWQAQGIIPDRFRSRIRAVDNNWGFVVIDAGNRSGVTSGAVLDVKRNGEVIGQVRVTNVEQSRAVADILKGSLAEGTTVQPGDSVAVSRLSSSSQWQLNQQAVKPATTPAAPGAPGAPGGAAPAPTPPAPVDPFADPAAPPAPAPAPAPPSETPSAPTAPSAPPAEKPTADPFAN
jgi:hypothetical protein